MFERSDYILSERPEDQLKSADWGEEAYERIKRSDEATKRLKEKYTAMFMENIRRARAEL